MKRIAIFASGSGTNAQNIFEFFRDHKNIAIDSVFTNNPDAYVLERAKNYNIFSFIFSKQSLYHTDEIINLLKNRNIDFIVLAGFLWLMPENIINEFPNKIINIHPALLPKYGGKGMYGMNVHKTIIQNRERESGITIHFVNNEYDEGKIIFQAKCQINQEDTPESLAQKVHELEYKYFPKVIEDLVINN